MTIAFTTLGCKVNHYETEALQSLFKSHGYDLVDHKTFADIYVINTCTVTNTSDSKSRKAIRRAIKMNPDAIIAVIGCYAQIDHETIAGIDGVDIIMGTTDRSRLLEHIETYKRERKQILEVKDITRYKTFDRLNVSAFEENTRAFIKIQDGCNEFCTYCIIPFARGRIRSRPLPEVIAEAKRLIASGFKELVLTGIHTGGYGSDLDDVTFYDLLDQLSRLEGLERLRISSIEINQLTDGILTMIQQRPVFARHLHIPLQHGANDVLKRMRRRYDTAAYLAKLEKIRSFLGDIAITTDVIVGFPGESDAEFDEMVGTIKQAAFSEMHIFPYSKRSGTKAAESDNHIHGTIKSVRVGQLLQLNEQLASAYREKIKAKNQTLSVLFERCDNTQCYGHTSEYIYLSVPSGDNLRNTFHPVKLIDANYPQSTGAFDKV